jgi:acyl-CoA thioester hydrolase
METEDGCMIPVVEANCRYRAPARYDEVLSIETEVAALRGSFLKFRYRIVRAEDNVLLAEGETMHVVTDSEMRKCPLPEKYRDALERVLEKPDRWRS